MYSNKKNVLQLVALLKAYNIKQIVISPGSRNSPLTHTFAMEPFFICHSVVDERSAAFYALGLIQALNEPVAVCCTSGSAVLNYAPAISEAFYQQLPLLVVTADRPECWIGQMAGQTIPQPGAYNSLVRKSVQLPEITTTQDEWYCNRLINEALHELNHYVKGPVQINVPLSEPLFEYTEAELPVVRKINHYKAKKEFNYSDYIQRFRAFSKCLIIVGQLPADNNLTSFLESLASKNVCVVLVEHLSNTRSDFFIGNFDRILSTSEDKGSLAPELLITVGGHIVSKRLGQFLRENPPAEHWHISEDGKIVDLYQHLTDVIEVNSDSFFQTLTNSLCNITNNPFCELWQEISRDIAVPSYTDFSSQMAVEMLMEKLPYNSALHLGNSLSVRYAQLFPLKRGVKVFCNRGTSGIDGCLSTAVGYAAVNPNLTFLLIGDLAFFFDMNALWNRQLSKNLRILVNNNGCGGIFHNLPGLNQSGAIDGYIAASHNMSARAWAESTGFIYLSASNKTELEENMKLFLKEDSDTPILLEAFTPITSSSF